MNDTAPRPGYLEYTGSTEDSERYENSRLLGREQSAIKIADIGNFKFVSTAHTTESLESMQHDELSRVAARLGINTDKSDENDLRGAILEKEASVLGGMIGGGSLGKVYESYDGNRSDLVIKVMSKENPTPEEINTFRLEALLMDQLSEITFGVPHVVDFVYDDERNKPYIIMRRVPGENLEQLVQNGELDTEKLITVALGVCEIVGAINNHGVFHKDIKPTNIMFDKIHELPRIIDLGVSSPVNRSKTSGTTATMDPILRERDTEPSAATDTYSIGKTLLHILSTDNDNINVEVKEVIYVIIADTSDLNPEQRRVKNAYEFEDSLIIGLKNAINRGVKLFQIENVEDSIATQMNKLDDIIKRVGLLSDRRPTQSTSQK